MSSWALLPADLVRLILRGGDRDSRSIVRFSGVCKRWRAITAAAIGFKSNDEYHDALQKHFASSTRLTNTMRKERKADLRWGTLWVQTAFDRAVTYGQAESARAKRLLKRRREHYDRLVDNRLAAHRVYCAAMNDRWEAQREFTEAKIFDV